MIEMITVAASLLRHPTTVVVLSLILVSLLCYPVTIVEESLLRHPATVVVSSLIIFSLLCYPVTIVEESFLRRHIKLVVSSLIFISLLCYPVTIVEESHLSHPVTMVKMIWDHFAGLPVFVWVLPISCILGILCKQWLRKVHSSAEKSDEPKQEDFPPNEPVTDTRPEIPMSICTLGHDAMIAQLRGQIDGMRQDHDRCSELDSKKIQGLEKDLRRANRQRKDLNSQLTQAKLDQRRAVEQFESGRCDPFHVDHISMVTENFGLIYDLDQVKGQLQSEKEKHQQEVNSLTQQAEQKHQDALASWQNEWQQKLEGLVEQARVETRMATYAECNATLTKHINIGEIKICSAENQGNVSQVDLFRQQVRQDTIAECLALLDAEVNRVRSQTQEDTRAECEDIIVDHVNQGRIQICDAEVHAKVAHRCPMAPPVKDLSFDLKHMESVYDRMREEKVSMEQRLEQRTAELNTAQAAIERLKQEMQKSDAGQNVLAQERHNAEQQRQAAVVSEAARSEAQQLIEHLKQELARIGTENRQIAAASETTNAQAQQEVQRLKQELARIETESRQLAAASQAKDAQAQQEYGALKQQVEWVANEITVICSKLEAEQGASFDPTSGIDLIGRLKGGISAQKQKHERDLQSCNRNYNLARTSAQTHIDELLETNSATNKSIAENQESYNVLAQELADVRQQLAIGTQQFTALQDDYIEQNDKYLETKKLVAKAQVSFQELLKSFKGRGDQIKLLKAELDDRKRDYTDLQSMIRELKQQLAHYEGDHVMEVHLDSDEDVDSVMTDEDDVDSVMTDENDVDGGDEDSVMTDEDEASDAAADILAEDLGQLFTVLEI